MAEDLAVRFDEMLTPGGVPPAPPTLGSLALLLELSFGLAAWKETGPDRWAVRCNPSSGNLHPTEAYVLARNIAGLEDGLHHYVSRDHALEHRAADPGAPDEPARLWVGLSSIHWREAWNMASAPSAIASSISARTGRVALCGGGAGLAGASSHRASLRGGGGAARP